MNRMKIYDMQVNHLTNPLGFRMERTVFSWKLLGSRGKKQTAASIQIATDSNMKNLLADTGFQAGADSLGWQIDIPLSPCTRYFWQVTIRTDASEEICSAVQWFETAKMQEPWVGKWITCNNREKRHPFFEKKILPAKPVEQARLYICGLGLYEAFYDNERIGTEYLTPYSNDYNEWVQYQTFDVTKELRKSGILSVLLGNGWYKARFGFDAHKDTGFYGKEWKLIADLKITYTDGTSEIIGTDDSWCVRRSNITFSNLYDGEKRDDTLPGLPSEAAICCSAPKGTLTARMSLPVTVHEIIEPLAVLHTPAGETVLDMGQEFAGIFTLQVHEKAGTQIHIQTGEILQNGNFYNKNLRSAKSEYIYITDGTIQTVIPHFTYYGYRYVKIEGITNLQKDDFRGLALYSNVAQTGDITTGHELVNRFISNVRWGLKSNFIDVPTDCPQRDERMGWTGDAQVFSPTATYLTDTWSFYAKYLYDMAQEQKTLGGMVPHVIPSSGVKGCSSVWGDAACIIPWNLYLFYGDPHILADQFESMRGWVDYIRKVDGTDHGWRRTFHFGDWLALDKPAGGAEQVLGATDEEFIANLYYAASAGIVAKAAAVLGDTAMQKEYDTLSREQFDLVKKEYYSATGRCCIKTQTALILTLKYHLSDNEALVKAQLTKLFDDNNGKLQTGFVGTPLLCSVLSDHGLDELAYRLLLNEEYPGWLHEVKLGATTVWERWNSLLDNGKISGISMNSMNHYSYGSVLEWMFSHVAGLRVMEEAPGYRKMQIAPIPNWDLRSADASYDSPAGQYVSSWKLTDPEHLDYTVTVPFGCEAQLLLPYAPKELYADSENPMFAETENGKCILQPGTYHVSYALTTCLKKHYDLETPLQELLKNRKLADGLKKMLPGELLYQPEHSIGELAAKDRKKISAVKLKKIDSYLQKFN